MVCIIGEMKNEIDNFIGVILTVAAVSGCGGQAVSPQNEAKAVGYRFQRLPEHQRQRKYGFLF